MGNRLDAFVSRENFVSATQRYTNGQAGLQQTERSAFK
jgi:hypothetical protein